MERGMFLILLLGLLNTLRAYFVFMSCHMCLTICHWVHLSVWNCHIKQYDFEYFPHVHFVLFQHFYSGLRLRFDSLDDDRFDVVSKLNLSILSVVKVFFGTPVYHFGWNGVMEYHWPTQFVDDVTRGPPSSKREFSLFYFKLFVRCFAGMCNPSCRKFFADSFLIRIKMNDSVRLCAWPEVHCGPVCGAWAIAATCWLRKALKLPFCFDSAFHSAFCIRRVNWTKR